MKTAGGITNVNGASAVLDVNTFMTVKFLGRKELKIDFSFLIFSKRKKKIKKKLI